MFCHKCGNNVAKEASFCPKCGVALYSGESYSPANESNDRQHEGVADNAALYDIRLTHAGKNKIAVIKVVREMLPDIGLKEAHDLVGALPQTLKTAMPRANVISAKKAFASVGATVEVIDSVTGAELEISDAEIAAAMPPSARGNENAGGQHSRGKAAGWYSSFREYTPVKKALAVLGILLAVAVIVAVLVGIIRVAFSSIIAFIAVVAVGYALYHRFAAKLITWFKYVEIESKALELPKGMNAENLLHSLSGKFNYPYFKGVRYNENGECVIQGQYSAYTVTFDEDEKASLHCEDPLSDKKARSIMLEAIAIRHYINKFFNPTLPYDAAKYYRSLQFAERQRKAVAIVLSIGSTLIVGAILLEQFFPGSILSIAKPGIEVRSAYLSQYSKSVTIDDAFNSYFENGKWSTYEQTGDSYVVFTGTCIFSEERADVKITFKVMSEQFIVDSLELNGREQSDFVLYSLLSSVYDD